MDEAKDERFSHILNDPSFRRIPKKVQKIQSDNRSKTQLKNKKFTGKCKIDERGCALKFDETENLKKLYNMDEESSEGEEISDKNKVDKTKRLIDVPNTQEKKKKLKAKKSIKKEENLKKLYNMDKESSEGEEISDKNKIDKTMLIDVPNTQEKKKRKIESENVDSSEEDSDADSESDDSENKECDIFDQHWEERERAPDTDEITRRLAVCHMDWDRIRAVDLFAVFNSFKPPDTSIVSVKIYPSEYGLQRMEEEKLNGPRELIEETLAVGEEEIEYKKGRKYHREKLRQYQMNRLKYYYAIVECDKPETSNILYEQLNGMEYESSSVRLDLRFVPDDLTFDHEPTSVAENPDLRKYKPKLFVSSAFQGKVRLTWDETNPKRREVLQNEFRKLDDIEKDIKEYLASYSEESEEELNVNEGNKKLSTKERIQQYKSLLESINEQEKENKEKY